MSRAGLKILVRFPRQHNFQESLFPPVAVKTDRTDFALHSAHQVSAFFDLLRAGRAPLRCVGLVTLRQVYDGRQLPMLVERNETLLRNQEVVKVPGGEPACFHQFPRRAVESWPANQSLIIRQDASDRNSERRAGALERKVGSDLAG